MNVALINPRDLEFQLYEVLNADALTMRARYADHSHETFDAAISTARSLAESHFATHRHESDQQEPFVRNGVVITPPAVSEALRAMADAGFIAANYDYALGGMQLPHLVATAALLWFDAANVATASYAMLACGVANLVNTFGSESQRERFLEPVLTGRFLGTMALTEADAGSSLADVRTRAMPVDSASKANNYTLSGTKMWISGGEHELSENIVHMVLARIDGAPSGVRGISLFLVPRFRVGESFASRTTNGVVLGGLIHKMGWRGTTSTILNFGEHEPCVGELVGEAHRGLACMFQMMNEARIGVGRAGTAMAYAAYRHALDYARTRRQGRLPGEKDPTRAAIPIIEHPDVRRMLLAQKAIAEGSLALILLCAKLVDDEQTSPDENVRHEAAALLEVLTPIAKAWPAEAGQRAISLAMQTLGGYGFAREYPIEQYYRDNRLNPIHEGTNGVQAIDLLGRKIVQQNGLGLRVLIARMQIVARDASNYPALAQLSTHLDHAITQLQRVTTTMLTFGETVEPSRALANASAYLDLMGSTVIAWLWLQQATVACVALTTKADASMLVTSDDAFYRGKIHTARYWFSWELPKTVALAELLERADAVPYEMRDDWF